MILHLIHDDKVVPRMISQFEEVCPGNNVFICVERACDKNYLNDNPYVIYSDSNKVNSISWKEINKICIHYLSYSKIRYFYKLCLKHNLSKIKVVWFIWSGDVYDIIERKGYRLYSSDNSYLKIRKYTIERKRSIKSYLKGLSLNIRTSISDIVRCYFLDKRVDYIVCNSKDEFDLFSKYIKFSRCKGLLKYNYYPLEDTLGSLVDKGIDGSSIIIGNSASESNNHEYVLSIIKDLDIGGGKMYVPLSYGENADYVKIVEEKYSKLPNAVILKKFLPLADYQELLRSCSTFVYGNFRSEAWGNILVALYLGGKVYVSKYSFLSKYLKTEGYKFFITEDIKETFKTELTKEEKRNNRRIAMDSWSGAKNKKNVEYISSV